jgi:hypothetical protein
VLSRKGDAVIDLASHQRKLLGLMRASYEPVAGDDEYFHTVARSPDLTEARGNVYLWRVYVLERTCVLTVALLRQRQRLNVVLEAFIRQRNISPFREFQPLAFLTFLGGDTDHLVASVSQFELALTKARQGDPTCHSVRWQVDPHDVLKALALGEMIEVDPPARACVVRVSCALPRLFEIEFA